MTRKRITLKDVLRDLSRLDGTIMVVDDELRKIRKDITEQRTLTDDDEARLTGLSLQLELLVSVARETRQTLDSYRKSGRVHSKNPE